MELKNKVAVITGGTKGIGKATVSLFYQEGADIVFTGLEEDLGRQLESQLKNENNKGKIAFKRIDITKESEVEELSNFVKEEFGYCEILFNNAGINLSGKLHETKPEDWDNIINVNLKGMYLISYYFIPHMLKNNHGTIINTSSLSGVCADYNMAAYNASKGAVSNLTRAMALDYADNNIRINAVCPGVIRTDMLEKSLQKVGFKVGEDAFKKVVPMHRIGEPKEIANVVLFLASDKSSYITGANILVDGGITAHTGQPIFK
jgi:Dehydrogenases with different specificities (related to short-chain alcohol dehydrogenases)